MARWLLMLLVSLFGSIPVFRRMRERRARSGGGAPGPSMLPHAESAKLAAVWAGFGESLAGMIGPVDASAAAPTPVPKPATTRRADPFVLLSRLSPWVMGALTILAFCWPKGSTPHTYLWLCGTSGLVGYWTNWIAIRLLFRPTKPRFGFGVIPANRASLVRRIAGAIEAHLVNPEVLASWLHDRHVVRDVLERWHHALAGVLASREFRADLQQRVAGTGRLWLDDSAFRAVLVDKVGMATRGILRDKVWSWVADLVEKPVRDRVATEVEKGLAAHGGEMMDGLLKKLDTWLDALAATLSESLDDLEEVVSEQIVAGLQRLEIRGLVERQLVALDDGELERLLQEAMRNELASLEVLGGLLGLLSGLPMAAFL